MDNEEILKIGEVEYHFKLSSKEVVRLEKLYGKNIFAIFEDLSFGSITEILAASLVEPKNIDKYDLMDTLLTQFSIIELGRDFLQKIAVKSGLLKKTDITEEEENTDSKNA